MRFSLIHSAAIFLSDLGFVGGTFCAVNGHNLIEPALCGIPVLFGPNVREQQVLQEAVIRYGAGRQAQDGTCRPTG
jgi:3-deoxy-D-manno-octulosonic-acid transferase